MVLHRLVSVLALCACVWTAAGCPSDDSDSAGGGPKEDGGGADAMDAATSEGGSGGTGGGADAGGAGGTGGDGKADAGVTNEDAGTTSVSAELQALCDDLVALHEDQMATLSCTGDDSAAVGRLCMVSGSCFDELMAHYQCQSGATTWSCDTTDGHPQTNGACKTTEDAYFACLGPAVAAEDPFGCGAHADAKNEIADALGCDPDTMIENTCNQLHLRDLCLSEWGDVVDCTKALSPADDFECDADNAIMVKAGKCTAEQAAFDTCIGN